MSGAAVSNQSRARARNRLSAVRVAKLKVPGLYEDGAGLRLVVTSQGTKRWVVRVTIAGRRVERGLGVWPTVSLEGARREAEEFRRAARDGRDARVEKKRAAHKNAVTFRHAFEDFFAIRRQQLATDKYAKQWVSTMTDYVFPIMGDLPVAEITAREVLQVLRPIWFTKPETAARVLQRLQATFDGAILRGTRERANPCIGVSRELGTGHRVARHHAALPWREAPEFLKALRARTDWPPIRLALEFAILTATRSGDVRGALWSEIDLVARAWTIPGADPITGRRTKTGEPHAVPLSAQALSLLETARAHSRGDLIFPAVRGQPLTDHPLSILVRAMKVKATPHGFRSTFKDWAAENGVPDEVSEAALAHADPNHVRAAYRRTRFFNERVGVMQRWANFLYGSDCQ